ncbi:MAG: ATP-binding protein [Lysinibacillus sp.]
MSIKGRLAWLLVGWSLLILVIASIIIYFSYGKVTEEREMDNLADMGERLLETTDKHDLFSSERWAFYQSLIPDDGMIRILDNEGTVIFQDADEDGLLELPFRPTEESTTDIVKLDGDMVATFSSPIFQDGEFLGTLELSRNMDDQMEDIETLLSILIAVSIFLLILAVFFGIWTSQVFLRPISVIGTTMNNIQKNGRFEKIQLPRRKRDEIYQLADNFNQMIDTLEVMFQKQEQFIANASHELKTPLTVIESYTSILNRWGKDDPALLQEGIDVIQDESKRLQHMIEQFLDLATMNQQPFELEPVELTEICQNTAKRLYVATNRTIHYEADSEPVSVLFNKERLVQVLIILLDNAIKYSEEDIQLRVYESAQGPAIQIIDHGIGIPKEEIGRLFERFYRVDKSRTRATGGSGLGLTIAKSLIEQSGGSITIDSEVGFGTTVTVFFQAAPQ